MKAAQFLILLLAAIAFMASGFSGSFRARFQSTYLSVKKGERQSKHPQSSSSKNDDFLSEAVGELAQVEASRLKKKEVSSWGILVSLAEEHIHLGSFQSAQDLALKAMDIASHAESGIKKDSIYLAFAEGVLAEALLQAGNVSDAAKHFRDALKRYESHYRSSTSPEAIELYGATQLIGWSLLSTEQFEEAKQACAAALGMSSVLIGVNSSEVATQMANLASAYINSGDLGPGPESMLLRALEIFENEISNAEVATEQSENVFSQGVIEPKRARIAIYSDLGSLYYMRGEDLEAKKWFMRVRELQAEVIHDSEKLAAAESLKNLGLIEWREGNVQEAVDSFQNALENLTMMNKKIEPQQENTIKMFLGKQTSIIYFSIFLT